MIFRAPTIALVSGSLRQGSFNSQLIQAASQALQTAGAHTTVVDLAQYELPLYHQDLEATAGMPTAAVALKQVLGGADAWVMASPEYNGFPSPLLVNAYTWCSRGDDPGDMYATFRGKTALVLGASPGAMGGLRAIVPHQHLLQNLGVHVVSHTVAIGAAYKAFDTDTGDLVDPKQQAALTTAVQTLFTKARDDANREATCGLIRQHSAGDYGAVSTPEVA